MKFISYDIKVFGNILCYGNVDYCDFFKVVKCYPIENVVGAKCCIYPSPKINGIFKWMKNDKLMINWVFKKIFLKLLMYNYMKP